MTEQQTAQDVEQLLAVVLVGGMGTRLGLKNIPKPMVALGGVPLLERTIANLVAQGVTNFIFLAGHLASVIEGHFGDGSQFGATIRIVTEKHPMGSAGAFQSIASELKRDFLVVYGDILFDVDIERFYTFHKHRDADATLYAHPNDHPFDSDLIDAGDDGAIYNFYPKPHGQDRRANLVSAALYFCSPGMLRLIPKSEDELDWGKDIFPKALEQGKKLFAYRGTEYLKDVGTPDRLVRGAEDFLSGKSGRRNYKQRQKAIFLDRDGVLNIEIDGVYQPEKLKLLPEVAEAIREFNKSDYLTICVTNQPGLAKGFFGSNDLAQVHAELDTQLSLFGAYLDELLYCPHHPELGFENEVRALKVDCDCRKPKPGLLLKASQSHNIELGDSIMVGDHLRDLLAGRTAGCKTLVLVNDGSHEPGVYRDRIGDYQEVASLKGLVEILFGEN